MSAKSLRIIITVSVLSSLLSLGESNPTSWRQTALKYTSKSPPFSVPAPASPTLAPAAAPASPPAAAPASPLLLLNGALNGKSIPSTAITSFNI